MERIIDFHSHILPGVDHGSDSVEISLKQLEYAEKHGVERVVFTSHFYPDRTTADSFIYRRDKAYERLLSAYSGALKFSLGAEVLVCGGLERLEGLERLCISGTRTLLLELPLGASKPMHAKTISALIEKGFRVVLAHIDRYDRALIDTYLELGCLAQLNADGALKPFVASRYKRLACKGKLVAIGSDIHGDNEKAYIRYAKALKKLGNEAEHILSATADLIK